MKMAKACRRRDGHERPPSKRAATLPRPLRTVRSTPACLKLKRVRGNDWKYHQCYVYDSSRTNRRTGRPVPGTGIPCGALSCSETRDSESFLKIMEAMDASLAETLRGTHFAAVSTSRIFRHRIAGMTFTVGEPPRLHFTHSSHNEGHPMESQEPMEQERLNAFCAQFPWERNHAMMPGTLHRLTRLPASSDAYASSLVLRLGRHRPDQECQRVVGDLCHRLENHLLIAGPCGSGKTTVLRSMIETLTGEFHKRRVGVVDEKGELSACFTAARIEIKRRQDALSVIQEAVRTHGLDVLIMDTDTTLLTSSALSQVIQTGVSVVMAVNTSAADSMDDVCSKWKAIFSWSLQLSFVLPKYRLVGSGERKRNRETN